MNRRAFLRQTAVAAAATGIGVRGALAAAPTRDAIPAIDTHTHFYDPARPQGVPWPPPTDAVLHRTVLPPEFRSLTAPHAVVGTVVVEASAWLEDNQWVLDLADRDDAIVGFVGHLKPGTAEFASHLRRFRRQPLFRGIRLRPADLRDLAAPERAADLRQLADADLSVDVLGGVTALEPALQLARAFPALRVVLNHLPFKDWDGKPAALRAALAPAERLPNLIAKVSEVVRRVNGRVVDDPAYYQPGLDALREIFGPERVMFGSNWPVSDKVAPYAAVHRVVAAYFAAQPRAAAEAFFWRNSRAVYRWVPRGRAAALV